MFEQCLSNPSKPAKNMSCMIHSIWPQLQGGTGALGAALASMAKLTNPVLCVDPSKEMLEVGRGQGAAGDLSENQVAESKEGVDSLCMSAEEWSAKEGKVDRIVIRGALHHFTRWPSLLTGRQMGGRLVGR